VIYLTVSTGIGGGIIIGGELYSGADGTAGEIGHMTIEADGPQCQCGNFGCLEVLASGTAVAREAVNRINQGEKSYIAELTGGKIEKVTAEIVARAAKHGDRLACEVVTSAAVYLGIGLANLVNIFNPDMIIIGGGMSKMGDMLLKPARQTVKQRAFKLPARTVRIVKARLGGDVGVIGAAVDFFEKEI
jgi:glucokinase